jgi:Protein of unknown function (DUF3421)
VLVGTDFSWVYDKNGYVPPGAIIGGRTVLGESLYIGRVTHNNALTVGKVHPSHRCLYIPYAGKEHAYSRYEVLVQFQNQDLAIRASAIEVPSASNTGK